MSSNTNKIIQVHSEFIEQIQKFCGSLWKEVYSEVHAQNKELPVWILFYEDTDLLEAHNSFKNLCAQYIKHIGDFQFTVTYEAYKDENLITFDFLTTNEEILRGWSVKPPLGIEPSFSRKKSSIYTSKDSIRKSK